MERKRNDLKLQKHNEEEEGKIINNRRQWTAGQQYCTDERQDF